ncbi:Cip1-interacting zinc finger protein [Bagarius yarrelli]|uniref:Cip1-interacting zinc finger protein n=1 Tax=Bagarius yarrelli TaxID=175774 RepID=A0A556V380_BAGYA|nr:Cip1-interacting zinc finger protein [Bagarius yarrelli]
MSSCRGKHPTQPYSSLAGGRSLLGAAPLGVPLKKPHILLSPCHPKPHRSPVKKEASLHTFPRKRRNKLMPEKRSNGQISQFRTNVKSLKEVKDGTRDHPLLSFIEKSSSSSILPPSIIFRLSIDAKPHSYSSLWSSVGVGTSLKVTIQRSSESRAFSTGLEEVAPASGPAIDRDVNLTADKYRCYICNVTSPDQLMAKVSSRPFCTVCERHFRTPRKFVEHMKSPEHKQQVEELKDRGRPEVMEELITLDAIGCFEDEDEYEEEVSEDEEATVQEQINLTAINDDRKFDPDTQYGTSFVVPVAGFLCKLCHRFYHFESRARETHCKSLTHFQNLQKYTSMLNLLQEDDENSDSHSAKVQNDENGIVGTEDRREEEEGEDNRLEFITHPHAGHMKKQGSRPPRRSPNSKLSPKSTSTSNPRVSDCRKYV